MSPFLTCERYKQVHFNQVMVMWTNMISSYQNKNCLRRLQTTAGQRVLESLKRLLSSCLLQRQPQIWKLHYLKNKAGTVLLFLLFSPNPIQKTNTISQQSDSQTPVPSVHLNTAAGLCSLQEIFTLFWQWHNYIHTQYHQVYPLYCFNFKL